MAAFEIPICISFAGAAFLAFDNRRALTAWIVSRHIHLRLYPRAHHKAPS